jgi:hypothetical protein
VALSSKHAKAIERKRLLKILKRKLKVMKQNLKKYLTIFILTLTCCGVFLAITEMWVSTKVPVMPLSPVNNHDTFWNEGYVVFEGTWVIIDDEHGTPLNVSKIVCRKERNECVESRAYIHNNSFLKVESDTHEIVKWSDDIIIYKNSAGCVEYTYNATRNPVQVAGVRTSLNKQDELCSKIAPSLKLRLDKGFDVWQKEQAKYRPVILNTIGLLLILLCGCYFSIMTYKRRAGEI